MDYKTDWKQAESLLWAAVSLSSHRSPAELSFPRVKHSQTQRHTLQLDLLSVCSTLKWCNTVFIFMIDLHISSRKGRRDVTQWNNQRWKRSGAFTPKKMANVKNVVETQTRTETWDLSKCLFAKRWTKKVEFSGNKFYWSKSLTPVLYSCWSYTVDSFGVTISLQ